MRESRFNEVRDAFNFETLKRVCEMREEEFCDAYDMVKVGVPRRIAGEDFYLFKDNGADILSVGHLDTVVNHPQRTAGFLNTAGGTVVYSGALDDRLGAYINLELLPALGIVNDWLLTVGEEKGLSTAEFFDPGEHHDREYNWMIEFDRGGTDVVMYDYEDDELVDLVRASGARVGVGIFTDICDLGHLEIKGINWGVGYRDYHGVRSHAYLDETYALVNSYLRFHAANATTYLPHEDRWDRWSMRWWDKTKTKTKVKVDPVLAELEHLDDDDLWADDWSGLR